MKKTLKIGYISLLLLVVGFGVYWIIGYLYVKPEYIKIKHSLTKAVPTDVVAASSNNKMLTPVNSSFDLIIPSVSLNLPVTPDVNGFNSKEYIYALTKGAAQLAPAKEAGFVIQGSNPGQGGNILIYAHTNAPWGISSNFQAAFNPLKDVNTGDYIYVYYKNVKYTYEVYEKYVTQPGDLSVASPTKFETLTLMGCWPFGSNAKRLIVKAEAI